MTRAFEAWRRWLRLRLNRARRDWRKPKGGPAGRLRRRLALGGIVIAALSAALAFPDTVARQARTFCEMPLGQPRLADSCGALAVPGVPVRAERLAWAAVRPGDCGALRTYKERFPGGVFDSEADRRLMAVRFERSNAWTPLRRETTGFVSRQSSPLSDEAAAAADARDRVAEDAGQLGCRPVDEHERLIRVEISRAVPRCRRLGGGHSCALDYRAVCRMEERRMVEICG